MISQVTPVEVARRRAAGESFLILDVREEVELAQASLPDVVWLPMSELSLRIGELDPSVETIVLCHHGIRSMRVACLLVEEGFEQVSNLRGGIAAWSRDVDSQIPVY